jgi:hypothetical protein
MPDSQSPPTLQPALPPRLPDSHSPLNFQPATPSRLPDSHSHAAALHPIVRVYGFPYGSPAVAPCATTAIGDVPSRGNLGRRDNTRINEIPHETRRFRGPTDKDCGLFKEDTSVLGHWPQSRLGQSKDAAYKRPKIKFIRIARSPFSLQPFLRAQVRALQKHYYRENTEESEKHSTQTACLFTPQTKHPPNLPSRRTRRAGGTSGEGTTREFIQSHMRRGAFGTQWINTSPFLFHIGRL